MLPIILSSTSPARKMLLTRLQLPFSTVAPNVDETPLPHETARDLVKRLAIDKARASQSLHPAALIIGCDQVAVIGSELVSKPETHERAVEQLQQVSGQAIEFYTGLCLLNSKTGNQQLAVEVYHVKFRPLSLEMIENYLHKEKPYHCAGSVRVEGLGISLLESLRGDDPTTLIGLPLIHLVKMLENEGVRVI